MGRYGKNFSWKIPGGQAGEFYKCDLAQLSVLMDIRDEIQEVKAALRPLRRLDCTDFVGIPALLKRIAANTTKPKRAKARRVK